MQKNKHLYNRSFKEGDKDISYIPAFSRYRQWLTMRANSLEGFHLWVNRLFPHRHPNIDRIVNLIKGIGKCEIAELIEMNTGGIPPPRKTGDSARLHHLKQRLTDRTQTPLQYLDATGHYLKLQWLWHCESNILEKNCCLSGNLYLYLYLN